MSALGASVLSEISTLRKITSFLLVSPSLDDGRSAAAIYSGLPGPYSENYVHFQDFLMDLLR